MDETTVSALLGRTVLEPHVARALSLYEVDSPAIQTSLRDSGASTWSLNPEAGIEFGFEDEADFLGLGADDRGFGPLLLTQIYLYGHHRNVARYKGVLPFGLTFDDSRDVVKGKLNQFENRRRSYVRDAWAIGPWTLVVGYTDDDQLVDFLLFLLVPPHSSAIPDSRRIPSIDFLSDCFGQALAGAQACQLLSKLGPESSAVRWHNGSLSLRASMGIDLVCRDRALISRSKSTAGSNKVLSEVILYRDRAFGATEWRGELPFGLNWDDSPERLFAIAPGEPVENRQDEFSGWALWHLARFSVQVQFSAMENFMVRIRVMAPGIWSSLSGA